MQTISRDQAADMIRRSGGKLFSVVFMKRSTKTPRRMVARLGVKKGVTGEGQAFNPADHYLITVHEFVTAPDTIRSENGRFIGGGNMGTQFRQIAIEGIMSLRIGGKDYTVA